MLNECQHCSTSAGRGNEQLANTFTTTALLGVVNIVLTARFTASKRVEKQKQNDFYSKKMSKHP